MLPRHSACLTLASLMLLACAASVQAQYDPLNDPRASPWLGKHQPGFVLPIPPAAPKAAAPKAAADTRATEPDVSLFQRALSSVWNHAALQTESDLRIVVSGQGAATTYRENIQLLANHSGQYRSTVTLIHPDGDQGVVYRVACDGRRVISYRSGLGEYALQSARTFEREDDDFPFLGLYTGALFLAEPGFKLLFDSITTGSGSVIRPALDGAGLSLTSATETLDGTSCTVFTLTTGPDSYRYRFFVDARTAAIGQIEMSVTKAGVKMVVIERVRSARPASPHAGDFALTLPPGARRVPELPVRPFYDLSP